jgi:hypothetical protein
MPVRLGQGFGHCHVVVLDRGEVRLAEVSVRVEVVLAVSTERVGSLGEASERGLVAEG